MPNDLIQASDADVLSAPETAVKRPPMYRVIMHNDDYTTTDFVVMILTMIFGKTKPEAIRIMLSVHESGKGVAGVYPHAIAETKVAEAHELANEREFPFRLTMEPV